MNIRSKIETKVIDKGAERIKKEFHSLDGSFTTIGVHEDAGSYTAGKSPPTVAQVAFFNEFGTKHIPERPFMRSTVDANRRQINVVKEKLLNDIVTGKKTIKQALDTLGFRIQVLVQNRIKTAQHWAAPLAPSTAAQKNRPGAALRGAVPLIDSGLLLRSITFRTKVKK